MPAFLDVQTLPAYAYSNFRRFETGERHVTRTCGEDVLVIIFSGTLRFRENGVPVEVGAGEYYIQRSGLFQQGIEVSEAPFYYYVHFHGAWREDEGISCRGTFAPDARAICAQLDEARSRSASLLETTAVFYRLLMQLRYEQNQTPVRQLAEQIRIRLQKTGADDVSLCTLSHELHFSENYLIRVFKQAYGVTPHAYLVSLRLERAVQLMRYSDLSLERIALESGFGEYVNFFKAYKKAYGTSPRQARRQ